MKTKSILKKFDNNKAALARALNITRSAISNWGDNVPELRAYQIMEYLQKQRKEKRKR